MATPQGYAPVAKKMKLEHENGATTTASSAASTPATTTPVSTTPAYSTAPQWSTQIPIDPVLQQQTSTTQHPMMAYQSYTYGSNHYPQTPYAHLQQYQAQQLHTSTAPVQIVRQQTQSQANEVDTADVATLNDALGSAGVDLRAEEETLQRSQDHHTTYRIQEDRSRKQPQNISFDTRILGSTMRDIGTQHKVGKVPEDSVNYVALALRTRLQVLIKAMIAAAEHRVESQYDRVPNHFEDGTPMWSVVVRQDTRKQLEVLERIEREEEMKVRRERRERADAAAAQAAMTATQTAGTPASDGAGGDDPMDGGASTKKAKKKRDGPGVTAKNMSEDVQKRLSNQVATQAAGLGRGKYAWMNAGTLAATPPPKPKAATSTPSTSNATAGSAATGNGTTQGTATGATASTSTWAKPYVSSTAKASASPAPGEEEKKTVTMRDAMFVLERERGHGAGRGAARGWV